MFIDLTSILIMFIAPVIMIKLQGWENKDE